jgi:5-(carboxyamino)imidazole ribonucleotide synthase
MANVLGDMWSDGEPDWNAALASENIKLHLYGKAEPRNGRKMGHITALAETAEQAERDVRAARDAIAFSAASGR